MAEEDTGTNENEVQLTATEQTAQAMGWQPKEAWIEAGKEEEAWKPARAFIEHGELMDRIVKQGKAIEAGRKRIEGLEETLSKTAQAQIKLVKQEQARILAKLKKDKITALNSDNPAMVVEIDDQIKEVETLAADAEALETNKPTVTDARAHEVEVTSAWIADPKNSWYKEKFELKIKADQYYDWCRNTKGYSPEEALEEAEKYIKTTYPEELGLRRTNNTNKVLDRNNNDSGSSTKSNKKYSIKDLNEDERRIAQDWVAQGVYKDTQEYVDSLAKTGYFNKK